MNSERSKSIKITNITKGFKVNFDKSNTLKDKFVRRKLNNFSIHKIIDNVNLVITKGQTVALIGVNGSGKSTLLKLISRIIYPDSGSIEIQGKIASLLELGAGFHPDFTGRENIYFNAAIFGFTKKETDQKLSEIIDFSELGDYIDTPVRTYSSGMYMRLAFSIAINVDADIMLFDEVLAVGDGHFQQKCLNRIKVMSNSETTVVIVSHDLNAIRQICDRAIWLKNGEIHMDGDVETVLNQYSLETM